jgi:hypothetical protein
LQSGQRLRCDPSPRLFPVGETAAQELALLGRATALFALLTERFKAFGQELFDACQHPFKLSIMLGTMKRLQLKAGAYHLDERARCIS